MRNGMQPILALLLGGMLWAAAAQADERQANDIRDRAHALQEKVQHLRDRGDHEAAQRLEQEVQELFQQADQVADAGPHERPPAEAWRQEFHDLYREWIEAIVGERDEAAEALQQKIHDYARETGARLQEMLQPQLEMVKRRIAELREQGRPELAERLAERQREVFQAHRRAQTAQQEAERAQKSRSTQGSDEPAWQRQVQDLIHYLQRRATNPVVVPVITHEPMKRTSIRLLRTQAVLRERLKVREEIRLMNKGAAPVVWRARAPLSGPPAPTLDTRGPAEGTR